MMYRASYVPKHIPSMYEAVAVTIECNAPDPETAAELLFKTANHGNEPPTGVHVLKPLARGVASMCPGDLAIVGVVDQRESVVLKCDLFGWKRK